MSSVPVQALAVLGAIILLSTQYRRLRVDAEGRVLDTESVPRSSEEACDGVEVCFNTTTWSPEEFDAVCHRLREHGVRFTVEAGEIVVEKHDENLAEAVITGTKM